MELYHSNCGDAVTLAMVPSDPATTLSNEIIETDMTRRLLVELTPVAPSERRKCPVCHKESTCERSVQEPDRSVDEFGDHIVGCKGMLPLRTKLWHDPLVQVWHMLARMAGLSCGKEVSNLMLHSGKRPDVVLFQFLFNILIDIRTRRSACLRAARSVTARLSRSTLSSGCMRLFSGASPQ